MSTQRSPGDYSSAWGGWIVFAAAVMFTIGALDIIQGIAALAKDEVYLVAESGLLVTTDYTAWGWTLIIWGIVLMFGAAALFSRSRWISGGGSQRGGIREAISPLPQARGRTRAPVL